MTKINIRPAVCATALMFLITALTPALATAANHNGNGAFPAGNSALNQYIENFPTAGGGKPSRGLHGHHRGGSNAVSPSTGRAMSGSGSAGQNALAFANSTAPAVGSGSNTGGVHANSGSHSGAAGSARVRSANRSGPGSGGLNGLSSAGGQPSSSGGSSGLSSVLSAFFGSSSNGGLWPWLPALLIVILLGGCAVGLRQRYRRGSS